jgi:hypothetical protein
LPNKCGCSTVLPFCVEAQQMRLLSCSSILNGWPTNACAQVFLSCSSSLCCVVLIAVVVAIVTLVAVVVVCGAECRRGDGWPGMCATRFDLTGVLESPGHRNYDHGRGRQTPRVSQSEPCPGQTNKRQIQRQIQTQIERQIVFQIVPK